MPIAPPSRSDFDLARIDWRRIDATTDADIDRQAAADADTAVQDVRALRTRLCLSQEAFATRFGFSVDAVRQCESHRRTLLRVIAREPDAVIRALAGG